jgi:glycosyltransferase involved in cell wall biosynthesis
MIDKFLVVTHVNHNIKGEKLYAYAPYVKEMGLWSKYAKNVEVIAPVLRKDLNVTMRNYDNKNTSITNVPIFSILSFKEYCLSIVRIPFILFKIFKAMFRAEHIHLRCPGNMGLLGCFAQVFFPHKPKTAKYAGNWDPKSKQPRSYRLQKWILSNTFLSRNIKVLVYGDWPEQSKNIVPFFTASFSETEKGLHNKDFTSPFKFIFVGSLSPGKRPLLTIKLIEALMGKGIPVKLEIYGSGVMKNELQEYIATKNLDPFVRLMGNLKLDELKEVYKASHFLILASRSEGWPKAVAEAMFFGCIPVVTSVSCVPWMVGAPPAPEGGAKEITFAKRGVLAPPVHEGGANENEWIENLVNRIVDLIKDTGEMKRKSLAAQEWSQEYTLERFEDAVKEVLKV